MSPVTTATALSPRLRVGYASGGIVAQPASALTAIAVGFSVVSAALVLVSLPALPGYRLTKREVAEWTPSRSGPP